MHFHFSRLTRRFRLIALLLAVPCFASAQGFLQPTVIPTGNWPAAIYSADMNGDGFPDLIYMDQGAVPNQPSTTHVLLNDGKGNFTQSAVLATSGNSLAIGDFNGDKHLDLAWAVSSGLIINGYYAAGTGGGTFSAPQLLATVPVVPTVDKVTPVLVFATAVQFADLGPPYLLVEDIANQELWFVGDKILFGDPLYYGAGPIFAKDLNGDGHTDIVLQGSGGVASVLLGDGNGNITYANGNNPVGFLSGSGSIHSLLLQDVNGDGRPDLIAEGANGRIDVFAGNGDGTFATTSSGGTGALNGLTGNGGHLIAIADRKSDATPYAITATPAGISTLVSNGTAYFGLSGIYNAGPGHTAYATADFNGDGYLDLAVDSPEGIAILYGKVDGSFTSSQAFATGQPAMSGAVGVFTGSGHVDAVAATTTTQAQVMLGDGTGNFTAAAAPTSSATPTPGLWTVVGARDFDGDGKLDIALTADGPNAALPQAGPQPNGSIIPGTNGIVVQLGNGDGTFQPPVNPFAAQQFLFPASSTCSPPFNHYPSILYGTSAFGDFNGDGLFDIANRDTSGYRILRGNNGSANSSSTTTPTLFDSGVDGNGKTMIVDCNPHAHDLVLSGNLNNDGFSDVVFQGALGNSGALLVSLGTTVSTAPVFTGDLSVDGSITTRGQLTAPALNATFNGPAISTTSGGLGFPAFPGSGVIADLDGDGNGDLIVAYANLSANLQAPTAAAPNYIYIWYGDGTGHFPVSAKHPVNPVRFIPSRNFYQVAVADVNGDSVADLILSDGYVVSVQLGKVDGTLATAETHYLAGQGINTISVADVNKDGKPDLILANGGAVLTNPVANLDILATNADVNTGGITVLLNQAVAPVATLTATPEPSVYFSPYTVTATVDGPGSVSFALDGVSLGTATVMNGAASIPNVITGLPGSHTLTAVWTSSQSGVALSISGTHTILRAPVAITFTPTTPLTVYYGQPIDGIFSFVTVDPANPTTGDWEALSNGIPVPGCTSLPTNTGSVCPYGNPNLLDAGTYAFAAAYLGDPINAPSTMANPVVFTILADLTTASLASSLNPSIVNQAVTFTASVQGNISPGVGTVTFLDGSTTLGTGTLDASGKATLTTSALSVGTHTIQVTFPASVDFNAAAATLTQIVNNVAAPPPGSFTLTVTPSPVTLGVGGTAILLVNISETSTFNQPVQLSCSGLPTESSCSFVQQTIAVGGGSTTLYVAVAAPHACGTTTPYFVGSLSLGEKAAATLLACLIFVPLRRRRRLLGRLALAFVALAGLSSLSGCGGCTDLGTYPGSYKFTVTATAQTSDQSVTIPLTITVK